RVNSGYLAIRKGGGVKARRVMRVLVEPEADRVLRIHVRVSLRSITANAAVCPPIRSMTHQGAYRSAAADVPIARQRPTFLNISPARHRDPTGMTEQCATRSRFLLVSCPTHRITNPASRAGAGRKGCAALSVGSESMVTTSPGDNLLEPFD